MSDYAQAAAQLKARLDARAKKIADFDAFYESLRSHLFTESEIANSALTYENAPQIEFVEGWPEGEAMKLVLGGATCQISRDRQKPSIAADIHAESGPKTVTFLVLESESPMMAQRVSLTPAIESKIGPEGIAGVILVELITGAP